MLEETAMRYATRRSGAVLALILALGVGIGAKAAETNKWHGSGVIVIIDSKAINLEGRANHKVSIANLDGAIYNAAGNSFLDKARYQVAVMQDGGVSGGGYKTFTEADGSKVFAQFMATEDKPPHVRGTFEFTGGTGKYEGISGKGVFHVVFLSETAAVDDLVGEYTVPEGKSVESAK
jgi:hypothetical protein